MGVPASPPTELFDITGKTALVTGSSRGIGFALAEGLARHGATVVLHGRERQALEASKRSLIDAGCHRIHVSAFDVTAPEQVANGIDEIEAAVGPIDILVNNAGIQRRAVFTEFSLDDWNEIIASNLTSAFLVGQQVARHMVKRGEGKIVNIGSVQSQLGRAGIAPYAASKGGIAMLTKGMCADLAGTGLQINALAPGYFATELTRQLVEDEEFSRWVAKRTPAGRWGLVDELVGALVFLVSPASSFVNGQIIYVDGGMTAVV